MTDDTPVSIEGNGENSLDPIPEEVSKVLDTIIEKLPEEERDVTRAFLLSKMSLEHFSGPIPHPRIIREYEEVLPGSANRILQMAENQQSHRHKMESLVIGSDIVMERLGLIAALVISMAIVLGGIYLIGSGKDIAGFAMVILQVAGVAGVFLYNQRQKQAELKERQEEVEPPTADETR